MKKHQSTRDGWVDNKGVRLDYLDTGPAVVHGLVPILFVPGALGSAERCVREMESLYPRRCLAMSLRGRGKSDVPEKGYTFEEQVTDIESLVNHTGLSQFCIMGYSVGASHAIEYAARNPHLIRGPILGDYKARYPPIRADWVKEALSFPQAIRGLQRESQEVILWNRLKKIQCPALVIKGGQPGSLLPPEAAELYVKHLKDVIIVRFEDSNHELSKPNYERYIGTIKDFLQQLDHKQPPSMVV